MKKCAKCDRENRGQALYCRYCGEKFVEAVDAPEEEISFDDCDDNLSPIVGMETQKTEIRDFISTVNTLIKQRGRKVLNTMNLNVLITGPAGSGKKKLANALAAMMIDNGIFDFKKGKYLSPLNIDDLDLSEGEIEFVSVDDAHKLLPRDKSEELTGTPLEYLFSNAASSLDLDDQHLILIIDGSQELQSYIEERPALKALFCLNLKLVDYTPVEVAGISESILKEKYSMRLSADAKAKLERVFNHERRNSEVFANAHLAVAKVNEMVMAATRRGKGKKISVVQPEDISGKEYVPKTLEEVMSEFDKYVGVDEIKETMTGIVNSIKAFQKLHPGETYELKDHYLFLGNPGTGKTTMARVFADALSAMGILPSGQLVEVAPKDLKGQYMGHTGPKVDAAFDRAMGGVLFIDEAYDMWGGENDTFGNEAVTALIKNVEDRRGKLIVILAGYPREMGIFATANPGISSRFNVTVNFRDYNGGELTEIGRRMIKAQGYSLDEKAEKAIGKFFEKMYVSRKKDFANAREVRNAVEKAIRAQNSRIQADMNKPGFTPDSEFTITMADFTGENENPPMTVDEVIATLDDLIGMEDIKQEIRKLANVAMVNRMRMERGLGAAALQPVNIILTGNPGTGKTTIAKRLGQVLHAAGVLPSDKVVEREAKSILSSYVNASGQNMDKAVDEAMGGVLFIDEAYNLLPVPGSQNNTGNEALDALMTRMENDKGKFVVVIAGYADRMEELVRRGNPGLMSRFNKRFHIDDYDAEALTKIFKINLRKRKFTMTPSAERALERRMRDMVANKGLHFGNAREAVNLLNEVIELQGNRIAADTSVILTNPDALTIIEEADIPQ